MFCIWLDFKLNVARLSGKESSCDLGIFLF